MAGRLLYRITIDGPYSRLTRLFWRYAVGRIVKHYAESVPALFDVPIEIHITASNIIQPDGTLVLGRADAYGVDVTLDRFPSPIRFVPVMLTVAHEVAHVLVIRFYGRKDADGPRPYLAINTEGNDHVHVVANDVQNTLGLQYVLPGRPYDLFMRILGAPLRYVVFDVSGILHRGNELAEIVRTRRITGKNKYWARPS